MENRITLLVLPPHTSHLLQPADVGVFGPLVVYHGQETDRLTCNGVRRISKAEWIQLYAIARQKAFTTKNILSAWRGAGLYPLNRQKVLRHLPVPSSRPTTPERPAIQLPRLSISPLSKETLQQANKEFKSKISQGLPLSSPTRQYAVGLAGMAENLATQVSILEKQNKAQMALLNGRKNQRSGKRIAIKGHFILSTKEVLEKVRKAEEETACKKATRNATGASQRGRKRKRPETPSEDEEEFSCNSTGDSDSDASSCIVVGSF